MPTVRVALTGATGRMGHALTRLAADAGEVEIVGGIGHTAGGAAADLPFPVVATAAEAGEIVAAADVVVDFSAPELLAELLSRHADALAGKALVVGTTGLSGDDEAGLARLAERTAVLRTANFSVGVNLLVALAERAAAVLGDGYDVEIVEAHHRRKVDAPSGTALELGRAVARGHGVALEDVRVDGRSGRPGPRPTGEIGFHAVRGGDVVGDHRVMYVGERERIELVHHARDRALFAEGALRAARWMAGRAPGAYTMRDVLGL
jgi:4-hydroxy-tetrahydrodipicolinate reductase